MGILQFHVCHSQLSLHRLAKRWVVGGIYRVCGSRLAKRLNHALASRADADHWKEEPPDGRLQSGPGTLRQEQEQEHGQEHCPDRCLLRSIKKLFHPVSQRDERTLFAAGGRHSPEELQFLQHSAGSLGHSRQG